MLPNYNAVQLGEVLDSEISLPDFMDESVYLNEFKNNRSLNWQINLYLFKKETLELLLSKSEYRNWKMFKRVNWLLFLIVFAYIIFFKAYWMFLFLPVYRLLVSLLISHRAFILLSVFVAGCSFIFDFNSTNFWFAFATTTLGFLLNKAIADHVEQIIFEKAFMNSYSFWKFYSNRLIFIVRSRSQPGFQELTKKYPELLNWP